MLLNVRGERRYSDVLDLIGDTPMVKISRLTAKDDATVLAKLESQNIGGSVKDRICRYIVETAEKKGELRKGMTILESTSGNTGIGLALVAAAKGYDAVFVMPDNVSPERRRILQAYGARVILTPGEKGTAGAIEVGLGMAKSDPGKYFVPDQFNNQANALTHYETTGREIIEQTGGNFDQLIVGIGTSGTAMGVGRRIKESNDKIKVIGVEPILGQRVQGLRNMREPLPPTIFDPRVLDERVYAAEAESIATCRLMARREGLLMGMSSGAIMSVALRKAKELGKRGTIVAILPDSGERYLMTELYNQTYSSIGIIPSTEHEIYAD